MQIWQIVVSFFQSTSSHIIKGWKRITLLSQYTPKPRFSQLPSRVSNSSRNSWSSNIEYILTKYSNSSSISNSTNTTKNGRFWASNSWYLTILHWILYLQVLKPLKNMWEKFTIVEIMYFCKNSVKPICIFVLFLFTPHFADSTRKFTLTVKSKNYVKSTYCSVKSAL